MGGQGTTLYYSLVLNGRAPLSAQNLVSNQVLTANGT